MLLQAQRKDASAGVTTLPLAEKMTLKVLEAQVRRVRDSSWLDCCKDDY